MARSLVPKCFCMLDVRRARRIMFLKVSMLCFRYSYAASHQLAARLRVRSLGSCCGKAEGSSKTRVLHCRSGALICSCCICDL